MNNIKPRIYIDKEGNWYQDGYPVVHRRTYLYNNKLLRKDEIGRYYIDEGRGRVYAEVEDTPFVVKDVSVNKDGQPVLTLNDETTEIMDLPTFLLENNIPYIKVKKREFTARFNRPSYYRLAELIQKEEDKYYIDVNGSKNYLNIKM